VEPGTFAVDVQCLSPEPAESRFLPRGVAFQADSLAAWISFGIGAPGSSGPGAGPPLIQPRWVTTGAESLLSQQKALLHKAFGVIPRQHYGMAEAIANISECEAGAVHVDEDFAAVEFLPSPDGSGFKVVGTNFTNLLTPLLRYEIGDMVSLGKASCECGCGGRVVQTIDGRQEDYVVLGNGARIGRLDHVFKDMLSIQQAQIYQKLPGAIIVYIVRGDDYSPEAEHALLLELRQRLGPEMKIDIQYRDTLERSGAGKLRFVVSDLSEGSLLSPAERSAS
jgi:phenylacetate-CoA ligase